MNTRSTPVRDENTSGVRAADGAGLDQATLLSVDKALLVVELLMRQAEPLPARAIASELGINRTTTHRLLNALLHRGWIEKPSGTAAYRLSLKFLALAHLSTQARSFLHEVRPALEHLSRLSRETVHLGVLDGFEVVHVDKIDSLERVGVASKIGSRGTVHTTGLGKALLAAGPDSYLEQYIAYAATRAGGGWRIDPRWLRQEIALTRARGYSIDDEHDSVGVRCLGVAVVGAGGAPLFAISLTGPSPRFTLERVRELAPEAMARARELSRQLGWEPPATGEANGRSSAAEVIDGS